MRLRIRDDLFFITVALVAALAIRLDLLIANNFVIDADEAIVGLMAKHILEGRGIPTFYYGQHYMGSFEALLVSGVFALFGISSVGLKLVPLIFSLILVVIVYQLGLELGKRSIARVAALLIAIPPSALVDWSSKARGGFIEVVVIGAISFLVLSRWLKSDCSKAGPLFLLGGILGLGWWINNQVIYFILPSGFFVLCRILSSSKRILLDLPKGIIFGFLGFFLGGLPFWLYNFEHHFASFGMLGGASSKDLPEHLTGLYEKALPIIFGSMRFWHDTEVFNGGTAFAWVIAGVVTLIVFGSRWREVLRLFRLQVDSDRPVELYILFVITGISIFTLSSFGWLVQAPRYLLPLYVGLYILVGYSFSVAPRLLGYLIVIGVLGLNLSSSYFGGRAIPGEPHIFDGERVSKDHTELISWLRDHKISMVQTNYWIGYRLAFETREDIRFKMIYYPYQVRIDQYEKEAATRSSSDMPFVLVPRQLPFVVEALNTLGFTYSTIDLSGYKVIYGMSPTQKDLVQIPADNISVESSVKSEVSQNAIDGDLETRWGSGEAQKPGMTFSIKFRSPTEVRAIEYLIGKWVTDCPRAFEISAETPTGETVNIVSPERAKSFLHLCGDDSAFRIHFNPVNVTKIILKEDGADPIFDWSIAELRFFR